MKKVICVVLAVVLVLSFTSFALAESGSTTEKNNNSLSALYELEADLSDPDDIAAIQQIIDDVLSGDAFLGDASDNSLGNRSISTYSSNIKPNGVVLGKFYAHIRFNNDGSYSGLHNYWYTKASNIQTLTLKSVSHVYYPVNDAIKIVERYYCYNTNPPADGDFVEIDTFYF